MFDDFGLFDRLRSPEYHRFRANEVGSIAAAASTD